jgi:hypothetical protein
VGKDWKEVLLRSGVPLEYEVAQMLAGKGFDVDADFPYMRRDVEGEKEHSIDVMACKWLESGNSAHICLLVECKYRSPEKTLLLFEAPSSPNTPVAAGEAVHAYDEFVPYYLKLGCFDRLEEQMPLVYKGVELHANDAVERDFRRSIEQLRYSAPVALRRAFDMTFFGHPADNGAWFFAKVVVTNARMMLVGTDVDVEGVQAAGALEDVATEVDATVLYSEYGPDYERHFRGVFADAGEDMRESAKRVAKYVKAQGKKVDGISKATDKVKDLLVANRNECREISTQFFVSNLKSLPKLVGGIEKGAKKALKGRTQVSELWKWEKKQEKERRKARG